MGKKKLKFDEFYQRKLARRGYEERSYKSQILLTQTHRFFGVFPVRQPRIVALVREKPQQTAEGVIGKFHAVTVWKSFMPIWDLATEIDSSFGVHSKVELAPRLPL